MIMKRKPKKLFMYKILKNPHAKQPYHWICVAPNTEIRHHSENYSQKHNALKAIAVEIKYRKRGVSNFEDCTGEQGKVPKGIKDALK